MHLKLCQDDPFKKQQKKLDLIGKKAADRITKVSKISPQKNSKIATNEHDKETPKEIYIYDIYIFIYIQKKD